MLEVLAKITWVYVYDGSFGHQFLEMIGVYTGTMIIALKVVNDFINNDVDLVGSYLTNYHNTNERELLNRQNC